MLFDLVQKAMENSNDGKSARNQLKAKVLESFMLSDQEDPGNFAEFYKVVKIINKVFRGSV